MPSEETPTTTELEPSVRQAAVVLARNGLPASYISRELGISVDAAKAVARFRGSTETFSTGSAELDQRVTELTQLAVEQAIFELQDPTSPHRIAIVKILVGRAASVIGVKSQTERDELREMFQDTMSGIRNVGHGDDDDDPDIDDDIPEAAVVLGE